MLFCFQAGGAVGQPTQKYVILCFRIWYQHGREAETRRHLLGVGYDVNKWIRGVRWQAWNGTSCLASSANCPGESEISQGLLRHSSWVVLFIRWLPREDPQTPSYVHIADRLAARYVCVERDGGAGGIYACGVWSVFWVQYSLWPVNSSRLPDNRLQGREVKWRVSGVAKQYLTTATTRLIIRLLWIK